MKTKYVLKNTKTGLYFKGYEGEGKGPKPTWTAWTDRDNKAVQYEMGTAARVKRRLLCQSQFVELIEVIDTSTALIPLRE